MQGDFQLRRRKIGIVVLALACLLTGCWIRSITRPDQFRIPMGKNDFHLLTSAEGRITWERAENIPDRIADWLPTSRQFLHPFGPGGPIIHARMLDYTDMQILWRVKYAGFDFGQGLSAINAPEWDIVVQFTGYVVPYWAIVIPLIMQSAYLLLSKTNPKPRQPFGS